MLENDKEIRQNLVNTWALLEDEGYYTQADYVTVALNHIEELTSHYRELVEHFTYKGINIDEETHNTVMRVADATNKIHDRLMSVYPEVSGRPFITGVSQEIDDKDKMPKRISVCPTYGADWTVTYVKQEQEDSSEDN